MGLFDKKKNVEQPSPPPVQAESAAKAAPASAPAPAEALTSEPRYGIRQAIELMRGLPGDNIDLVVHVVKKTLESLGVRLETIIQDAATKQAEIEARIAVMRDEIAELDQEIQLRREEITRMDADCREIVQVRERLLLAEHLGSTPPLVRPARSEAPRAEPHAPEPRTSGQPHAPEPRTSGQPHAPEPRTSGQHQVVAPRTEARPARADATPVDLPVLTVPPPIQRPVSAPATPPPTRPLPGATLTPKK